MQSSVDELVRTVEPNPASYLEAARALDQLDLDGLRPVKIAVTATFTAELVAPYVRVEAARRGLDAELHFAPYGQLELQLLDGGSPLHAARPDVIVIASRLEDVSTLLGTRFVGLSQQEIEAEIRAVEQRFADLVAGARALTSGALLVFNWASPRVASAGLADPSLSASQASVVQDVNDRIARICAATPNCHVFDYARLVTEFGSARWTDPKLLYMARVPFGAAAQLEVGRRLARYVKAVVAPPRKCLVVDLDNTLWGGVLGEDGLAGIKLGEDFPGSAFKAFQHYLSALRARGVLLAIASKNNRADVDEVFARHADCVLKATDFAALEIHWNDKASSLASIARTLNIGTDSLVFFDDSAVECEWVRRQMPEVAVIQAPASAIDYVDAVERAEVFDHLVVTAEDRQRAEQYRSEAERREVLAKTGSVEDFLRALEMIVTLSPIGTDNLPRVAQLIAKTNQFNLTTRRHSASDLAEMLAQGAVGLCARVADRYGDSGLVGVAIAVQEGPDFRIDTFLLSCRVIGRRVETALLAEVAKRARQRGGRALVGEYVPTSKNDVAKAFYPEHGFVELAAGRWRTPLDAELSVPSFMTVREA